MVVDYDGLLGAGEVDEDADAFMICEGDCDDTDATIYPGATDPCNGVDQDCDGADGVPEGKTYGNCADGEDNDYDGLADMELECFDCFIGSVK